MPTDRQSFLDVDFDTIPLDTLLSRIGAITSDSPYGYLVTPNVDHIVRLHKNGSEIPQLAGAYAKANFCTCDSRVLARLAKWRGVDLPVIPGSDLAGVMFERLIRAGDRVAVIGGDAALLKGLRARYPGVDLVQHCPPMGLMRNAAARTAAAQFIADQKPRFTFICVGSPQQELIAAEAARMPGTTGLSLCVGAALEFLTDQQRRAPRLVRKLGIEWAHRLASNPSRLWRRYLVEGPAIFLLAYRWRRTPA